MLDNRITKTMRFNTRIDFLDSLILDDLGGTPSLRASQRKATLWEIDTNKVDLPIKNGGFP